MKVQRAECGVQSGNGNERLLKFLQATPEQQAVIDRILSGQLSLDAIALRGAETPKGPLLMMIKDAATLLGVHRATIWRLVRAGRLEAVQLLGSVRIRRADVEGLAAGHQACGQQAAGHQIRRHLVQGHQARGQRGPSGLAAGKEGK